MKSLTQICLLMKRILCKPIMILVLLIVPICVTVIKLLPDDVQSTEIVSGIYVESPTERSAALVDYLANATTGFTFREYATYGGLTDAVAAGDIDSGYALPTGFEDSFVSGDGEAKITVYETAATSFREVTTESVYAALLRTYAPDIAENILSEYAVSFGENDTDGSVYLGGDIDSLYENYLAGDVFTINTDVNGTYTPVSFVSPDNLPVDLMVYIIIIICALLGLQNYMCDHENGVYSALNIRMRSSFCVKNIAAGVIPAAISGILSILIYTGGRDSAALILHLLTVSVLAVFLCWLLRSLFRSRRAYTIAMPYIIIGVILTAVILTV